LNEKCNHIMDIFRPKITDAQPMNQAPQYPRQQGHW